MWHGDTRLQDRHISESEHKHICLEHIGAWSGETLQEGRAQGSGVAVMRHPGQGTGWDPHLHFDPARSLGQVGGDEPVPGSGGGDVHKGGVLHGAAQRDADVVGGTDGGVGRKAGAQRVNDGRASVAKVPAGKPRGEQSQGCTDTGKINWDTNWPGIGKGAGWKTPHFQVESSFSSGEDWLLLAYLGFI